MNADTARLLASIERGFKQVADGKVVVHRPDEETEQFEASLIRGVEQVLTDQYGAVHTPEEIAARIEARKRAKGN